MFEALPFVTTVPKVVAAFVARTDAAAITTGNVIGARVPNTCRGKA